VENWTWFVVGSGARWHRSSSTPGLSVRQGDHAVKVIHTVSASTTTVFSELCDGERRMKDCEGPSTNDDDQLQRHLRASVDDNWASNGGLGLSNGSAVGKGTCRRRAASGGGCRCGDVNGSISHVVFNGHLTAPRVEQRPTQLVAEATGDGFVAAEHVGGGGGGGGGGWAVVPTRAQILRDLANLCTFTGAILATLAMACMWKGRYEMPVELVNHSV